jgi:HAD superfamily hydrolase (TIGR01509 family)
MDGTLLDSMTEWDSLGFNHLKSLGVEPPEDLIETMREMSVEQSADYFMTRFALWETKKELLKEWSQQVNIMYEKRVVLKPFVKEHLHKLKTMGIKMCVATATPKKYAVIALERLGILNMFEFVLCEDDVGVGKHKPDIYIKAADMRGVMPNDAIVFEDALYAVKSAKSAGFVVCGVFDKSFLRDKDEIKNIADHYIYDFSEILELF